MEWLAPIVGEVLGDRGVLLETEDLPHLLVGALLVALLALQRKQSGSSSNNRSRK